MPRIPRIAIQIGYHLSFFPKLIFIFYLNFFETYNPNGSQASFGLPKTSMHFAIDFWFWSVGFTRLRLALFSTGDLLESEFNKSFCASSSCSLSPLTTGCGSESFKVEVLLAVFLTYSTKRIFSMNGQELINVVSTLATLSFTFLRQFSLMLCSWRFPFRF